MIFSFNEVSHHSGILRACFLLYVYVRKVVTIQIYFSNLKEGILNSIQR